MFATIQRPQRGVVLILALLFVTVLAILSLAFSQLTLSGRNGATNIQGMMQARAMADVAVADEMRLMNMSNSGNPQPVCVGSATVPKPWGNQAMTSNVSWYSSGNGNNNGLQAPTDVAYLNAQLGYYVDNTNNINLPSGNKGITFTAHGVVSKTALGVNDYDEVRVHLNCLAEFVPGTPTGVFPKGAFGKASTSVIGNGFTDSYDASLGTSYNTQAGSTDPNTAPTATELAAYHSTSQGSRGDVGSNGGISGNGNTVVYGNATPGVGQAVSLTSGARVTGATASEIAAAIVPDYTYSVPSGLTSLGSVSGTQTIAAGSYHASSISLSGKDNLTFTGNVTLYVDGDISESGNAIITLPTGASVTIYSAGSFSVTGNGFASTDKLPSNFAVLTSGSTAKVTGNGTFFGTVFAPNADVSVVGNGDSYGAVIGNTVTINGNGAFHWDKSAKSPAFAANPKAMLRSIREVIDGANGNSVSNVNSGF